MSRDGLYKSMALCALGQQGKGVEEKNLMKLGDAGTYVFVITDYYCADGTESMHATLCINLLLSELPKPNLASVSELRDICMKVLRATRPTELGYTYEELKSMDDISVTIMPEKKGMVFKHVEYLVESRVSI